MFDKIRPMINSWRASLKISIFTDGSDSVKARPIATLRERRTMEDLRSERRYRINDSVLLYTYRESREGTVGRIDNVSSNGIGVIVSCPLADGEVVRVDIHKTVVLGTVLRCTPKEKEYSVGLQLVYSMTKDELKRILGRDFQSPNEAHPTMKIIADSLAGGSGMKTVQRLLGF
jgi:hypothetical protein